MVGDIKHAPEPEYTCSICEEGVGDRSELIEHLRTQHELLEVFSYAATTMAADQDRDKVAKAFHKRFESLKMELAGREDEV